jgi:hypothetical protein
LMGGVGVGCLVYVGRRTSRAASGCDVNHVPHVIARKVRGIKRRGEGVGLVQRHRSQI